MRCGEGGSAPLTRFMQNGPSQHSNERPRKGRWPQLGAGGGELRRNEDDWQVEETFEQTRTEMTSSRAHTVATRAFIFGTIERATSGRVEARRGVGHFDFEWTLNDRAQR